MQLKEIETLPELTISWSDVENGRFYPNVVEFSLKHGSIFRFRLDGFIENISGIYLAGPEANRFVFHTGRQHFSHELGWTPLLGPMVGRGLINMDDPDHAIHRKMWSPAFAGSVMRAYIPPLHQIIEQKIKKFASHPWVEIYREAQEVTFDVAAAVLAGMEQGAELDRLRALFWRMLHADDAQSAEAYMQRMNEVKSEMLPILLKLIHNRRSQPASTKDVLSQIVHAEFEDGSKLDDAQILAHLNILLIAGHETTTSLSAWLIYQLATLPDHWARLQAEVDQALADIPIGRTDMRFTASMLQKMPQLDNFIKETGRMFSPVFQVPRITLTETEYAGYRIPADTRVRLPLWATHMHPDVFSDPEKFDPDRFAEPRREDRAQPYSLVTFGGGPRICIGINFANIEVKVLAAHILRHYQLGAKPIPEKRHVGYWTTQPKYPLEVNFSARQ